MGRQLAHRAAASGRDGTGGVAAAGRAVGLPDGLVGRQGRLVDRRSGGALLGRGVLLCWWGAVHSRRTLLLLLGLVVRDQFPKREAEADVAHGGFRKALA